MKKKPQNSNRDSVKFNLTLTQEFYEVLKKHAKNDYAKPATWAKQLLMKTLMDNNTDSKSKNQNETKR